MVHTSGMLPWMRRAGLCILLAGLPSAGISVSAQARRTAHNPAHAAANWRNAAGYAAGIAPHARVLVLDIRSGRLLASAHLAEAAHTLATPGSTLKPLILYYAISSGLWSPERRVACSRQLRIGTHQLNCSHPAANPMDAVQALTWSCNSYFASLAAELAAKQLSRALSERGLFAATGLTKAEYVAEFRLPRTPRENQLVALGVEGIRITLPELAEAYRSLAIELATRAQTPAARTLRAGLADSASFGMADEVSLGGVPISGKTGTAGDASASVTHGWFVGLAPSQSPSVVVAVYLPVGRGADAAQAAAALLAHSPLRQP